MVLQTERGSALSKPDGGYVQISTLVLGLLWWAYTEGRLSLRAVRVGLALFRTPHPQGRLHLDREAAG